MAMEKKGKKPDAVVSIFAGASAGAAETLITYPTEYIKTRRQFGPSSVASKDTTLAQLRRGASSAPSSLQVLRDTLRTTGFRGLYSGCSALAISNAAKGGVRFISFSQSQAIISTTPFGKANPGLGTVVAGLIAGATESVLVVTPGEALKTRIIHSGSTGKNAAGTVKASQSLLQVATRLVRIDGLRSLWNGLGPVLCKQGTNSAVRFATFESIRQKLSSSSTHTGVGLNFAAGAASGVVTTYASMPFDNLKTRMQMEGFNKSTGMFSLALSMLRNEGVTVFWRATTPRLLRLVMSSAITFSVFNQVVQWVG